MDKKIEISLSKKKMILLLIGCIVFITLGILFVSNPQFFITSIMRSSNIVWIVGIVSIFFFGICFIFIVIKIFDNKPGLVINQVGIIDNTNATSIGLIKWDDIIKIEKRQVMSNKFLIIYTNNPEDYINKTTNFISKYAIKSNYKNYGSPITIISNSLKIDFDELEELLKTELKNKGSVSDVLIR